MPYIKKQLWENQLWETVGFAAKAGFLFLLTPLMLRIWGKAQFGEFALAGSLVVFVSLVDFGIRGTSRVRLCQMFSQEKIEHGRSLMTESATSLLLNIFVVTGAVVIFTILGLPSSLLGLSDENRWIVLLTTVLSSLVLWLGLCTEPLVARDQIGVQKLAIAMGSLLAIPLTALVVLGGGGPCAAIVTWQGSLVLGLLALLVYRRSWRDFAPPTGILHTLRLWKSTVRNSFAFHVVSTTGIGKTHGLTLIISAIGGPGQAGVFFIFLRLAEMVSSLGAVSAELLINILPYADSASARRVCLQSVNRQSLFLGGSGAILLALVGPWFLQVWLGQPPVFGWVTGLLAAIYGLSTAFRQTSCNALIGLGRIRFAAVSALAEGCLALAGAIYFQKNVGLVGAVICAIISSAALLPAATIINQACAATWFQIWVWPWTKDQSDGSTRRR